MVVNNLMQTLVDMHVIDIFIPIILIFSVIYAALWVSKQTSIINIQNNMMMIISLTISIIAVTPHVLQPGSKYDIVQVMMEVLPNIGLLFIGVLSVLMLMGFIGGKKVGESLMTYITIGIIGIVTYLFLVSIDFLPSIQGVEESTISALLALLVFGLIVMYITSPDEGKKDEKKRNDEYIKIIEGDFEKDKD